MKILKSLTNTKSIAIFILFFYLWVRPWVGDRLVNKIKCQQFSGHYVYSVGFNNGVRLTIDVNRNANDIVNYVWINRENDNYIKFTNAL